MKQPGSHELYAYWDRLRGSRAAPDRADLDPAAIPSLLYNTFILTVDTDRTYPFCISSSGLDILFDAQLNGRSFLSLWNRSQRPEIDKIIRIVMDDAAPIVGGAEAAPEDYEAIAFEFLLLPLRHDGKTHSRVLGWLAPAYHPPWFGLRKVENLDFKSMRILDAHDETQSAFFSRERSIPGIPFKRRGHLRIYTG